MGFTAMPGDEHVKLEASVRSVLWFLDMFCSRFNPAQSSYRKSPVNEEQDKKQTLVQWLGQRIVGLAAAALMVSALFVVLCKAKKSFVGELLQTSPSYPERFLGLCHWINTA